MPESVANDLIPSSALSVALDAMNVGMQLLDRDWRYVYLNPAASAHGRRARAELLGRTMLECYPGIEETEMFAALRQVMAGGEAATLENRFTYPDGEARWFELRIEPSPVGVLIVSIDVTARKRTEQQFRHAQKMELVGRLAGGIAHDFNNLLTVIQICGEFAGEAIPPDNPARAEIEQIFATVQRATALTRQLLTFSSAAPVKPAAVPIDAVITEMEQMLRRLLGANIALLCAPASGGRAWIDRSQLEQVIVNLAVNARDAMPGGGRLTIETSAIQLTETHLATQRVSVPPGHYVVIAVTDTGTGMTPQVQERVFEPFFTTKGEGRGTGLGLATCWGIVQQAGGYLWPYSELGHGTTFRVYLPRVEQTPAADEAHTSAAPPSSAAARGTERVLLVEDNPDVREAVTRALESQGFTPILASSAEEALERCADTPFDLLLVDMVLPGQSGPELAERLVRQRPGLPVVYISGYAERALARLPLLRDAIVIDKPFNPRRLAAKLREALDGAPT